MCHVCRITKSTWMPLAGLALLAGCESGQFGAELVAQPKAYAISSTETTTLRLPRDQSYNIALPRVMKEPRLGGTAEADAEAAAAGTAMALAEVDSGGVAEGVFQLGHALRNATDRQTDFEVDVKFSHAFTAGMSSAAGLADAMAGLRIYARTARGRILRDIALLDYSTESGPINRSSSEGVSFTVTLGPEDTLNVFLAGRARVDVPDDRSAHARLELTDVTMDITAMPAPAVQAAGGE